MPLSRPLWHHWDISRTRAEELLAKANKDGSFLVRDSESVAGAYALCLLFQKQVHTYRILQDSDNFLAVQTSQGVQVKRFSCLGDLITTYQQPNQGLVTSLLYPVEREKEREVADDCSDGEDERPALPPRPGVTGTILGSEAKTLAITQQLQQRIQDGGLSSDVVGSLSEYLRANLQQDLECVRSGSTNLRHLNSTIVNLCHNLQSEVDLVLSNMEVLMKVFDKQNSPMTPPKKQLTQGSSQSSDTELDKLVNKISSLNDLLSSAELKVLKSLQEMINNQSVTLPCYPGTSSTQGSCMSSKSIPLQSFEVRLGKTQKQTLILDVEAGKLHISKKSNSSPEESISYEKILQLIKYQSTPSKLQIVFEKDSQKNQQRDFIFENARKREAFCQLLQLIKNRHSNQDEPDMISVFIGTWNMGSAQPPKSSTSWLMSKGLGRTRDETTAAIPHDIYVIGTQENALSDKDWVDFLRATIKDATELDFKVVATQSLWNIKIAVLIKADHENRVSHINTSSVKTGIANTLGNKGAVGVSFLFNGTSFGFVNCHLTSGSEKVLRRNQNYLDILRLLQLGDKQLSSFDITLRFTHLFWLGDLNYRLDMDVQDILNHINKKEFEVLMSVDQLNLEREKSKVFLRFCEDEITFPPTYRYERNTRDLYAWQKFKTTGVRINVPSWCDRVLWKAYPETYIQCTSYGCTDDIVTSDHSPVFATFEVGVTSQFVSKKDPGNSSEGACIEFETIDAIVKTTSKTKFFIEIYSGCLEEFKKTAENDNQYSESHGFLRVAWSSWQLPLLVPILSDMEYLQDQHLLLTVKSTDGYESYGECCIALKSMIGSTAQQFETCLSHRGEESGFIRGKMKVCIPSERRATRERLYDWISFEKDETGAPKGKIIFSNQDFTGDGGKSSGSFDAPEVTGAGSHSRPDEGIPVGGAATGGSVRGSEETPQGRLKQSNAPEDDSQSSCFNNPSYFVLEGIPYSHSGRGSQENTGIQVAKTVPRNKLQPNPPKGLERVKDPSRRHPSSAGFSSEDESLWCGSDQLPGARAKATELEMQNNPLYASAAELWDNSGQTPMPKAGLGREERPGSAPTPVMGRDRDRSEPKARGKAAKSSSSSQGRAGAQPAAVTGVMEAGDSERLSGRGDLPVPGREWPSKSPPLPARNKAPDLQPRYTRPNTSGHQEVPPPLPAKTRSVDTEASDQHGDSNICQFLKHLGLEVYEAGLIKNGWDHMDYFHDVSEGDLTEAGVADPSHRRLLLEKVQELWR
uniref:phosphatidylinositol-3,4,5-trisphosphate 5-phosphatase n=1 Tax=Callorhinchus milii TaxID=7868 RepID=V9K8I1_CALMI